MALIVEGQRFGRWTALEDQRYTFVKNIFVKCECGTKSKVRVANLNSGRSQSCGCLNKEALVQASRKKLQHPVNAGDKFGRLTVVDAADRTQVQCVCSCGGTTSTRASALYRGNTRSCGCLKRERASELGKSFATKNGITNNTLYGTWKRIVNSPVPLHAPWRADAALFISEVEAAIGPRPKGMRLTMKNVELGYVPGNVEWGAGKVHPNQRVILTTQQRQEIAKLISSGEKQYQVAARYGISSSLASSIYRAYRYSE